MNTSVIDIFGNRKFPKCLGSREPDEVTDMELGDFGSGDLVLDSDVTLSDVVKTVVDKVETVFPLNNFVPFILDKEYLLDDWGSIVYLSKGRQPAADRIDFDKDIEDSWNGSFGLPFHIGRYFYLKYNTDQLTKTSQLKGKPFLLIWTGSNKSKSILYAGDWISKFQSWVKIENVETNIFLLNVVNDELCNQQLTYFSNAYIFGGSIEWKNLYYNGNGFGVEDVYVGEDETERRNGFVIASAGLDKTAVWYFKLFYQGDSSADNIFVVENCVPIETDNTYDNKSHAVSTFYYVNNHNSSAQANK